MRGRAVILMVPLLIAIIALGWLRVRESGPRFKGRSVEEWLVQYGQAAVPGPMREDAEGAIRSLGTNIIPEVIRALNYVETRRHAQYVARLKAMFLYLGIEGWLVADEPYRLEGAMTALPLLDADARYALPRLVELLERPGASVGGARAGKVLASLGPMGCAALIAALDNRDPFVRFRAVMNLDSSGRDAPLVLDALVKTLEGGDPELFRAAASALSRTKVDPKQAVPIFVSLLNSTNLECRVAAIRKLSECGPAAREVVPALLKAATHTDQYLSQTAIVALQAIAPEVLTNFPGSKLHRLSPRPRLLLPND